MGARTVGLFMGQKDGLVGAYGMTSIPDGSLVDPETKLGCALLECGAVDGGSVLAAVGMERLAGACTAFSVSVARRNMSHRVNDASQNQTAKERMCFIGRTLYNSIVLMDVADRLMLHAVNSTSRSSIGF
jgi:hypothetical protein